jgi:hypothetical protein
VTRAPVRHLSVQGNDEVGGVVLGARVDQFVQLLEAVRPAPATSAIVSNVIIGALIVLMTLPNMAVSMRRAKS